MSEDLEARLEAARAAMAAIEPMAVTDPHGHAAAVDRIITEFGIADSDDD